ncbi:hypothetical protein FRC04_007796 [Tulasnella sp. 424]|nr:hypothetical protein FRC04_007796 [Tulasnella sp. 424]KAG8975272.1 hypothetical protein FRC05_006215 [Tulasnella sp. 425]
MFSTCIRAGSRYSLLTRPAYLYARSNTPVISRSSVAGAAGVQRSFHISTALLKKGGNRKQGTTKEDAPAVEEEDDFGGGKKGKKKSFSVADLTPASQSKVAPEAKSEIDKTSKKMTSTVEWYRKEMSLLTNRALGRVTPAILDSVRVQLPDLDVPLKLSEVATVGVKEGTVLVVTAFDEHNLKAIEKGIYHAEIPHCVPQRADGRTIRIPMPKPTLEDRASYVKTASKQCEETKVKIRSANTAGLKSLTKMGYEKRSSELVEMQSLSDTNVGEVEKIFQKIKKDLGA